MNHCAAYSSPVIRKNMRGLHLFNVFEVFRRGFIDVLAHFTVCTICVMCHQPERFVAWLGVDSGVLDDNAAPSAETQAGDRAPVSGGDSGGRGSTIAKKLKESNAPPPFKAADVEGLRVEAWLLEVSTSSPLHVEVTAVPIQCLTLVLFSSILRARSVSCFGRRNIQLRKMIYAFCFKVRSWLCRTVSCTKFLTKREVSKVSRTFLPFTRRRRSDNIEISFSSSNRLLYTFHSLSFSRLSRAYKKRRKDPLHLSVLTHIETLCCLFFPLFMLHFSRFSCPRCCAI